MFPLFLNMSICIWRDPEWPSSSQCTASLSLIPQGKDQHERITIPHYAIDQSIRHAPRE